MVAQSIKNLPAMQEMRVGSLGQDDPLEKDMTHHSSILAWRIPWTEEPGGLRSIVCKESDVSEATEHSHMPSVSFISIYLSVPGLTDTLG